MRRVLAALAVLGLLHGCRDFDEGLTRCAIDRICTDGQSSAGFALTFDPSELTLMGQAYGRTRLKLTYPPRYYSRIGFHVEGAADAGLSFAIPGDTGAFDTDPPPLDVQSDAIPTTTQTWTVTVVGTQLDGGVRVKEPLRITVVPSVATTLVVDDDHSNNNFNAGNIFNVIIPNPKDSPADLFFGAALRARGAFDTWVQPDAWDGGTGPLTFAEIQKYTSIVWYTDRSFQQNDNITAADDVALRQWLDQGNRKLILISENYVGYQVPLAWDMVQPDKALAEHYVGVLGGKEKGAAVLTDGGFTFAGVAGQTTAGLSLHLPMGASDLSLINPKAGTQPLLTVRGDPDRLGERDIAMATVRRNIGDAGTSTALYVGFALVEVVPTDAGSREKALDAFLDSAGF